VIQINGLNKSLFGGGHKVNILNGIDLVIPSGQFVAITGVSGSGKTTLLSLIAGLDEPTEGNIKIDGQDITKLSEDELAELRSQYFGFIFQNFNLIPTLTALENVTLSAELNGSNGTQKKSTELLSLVGLENRNHHYPAQLSGGEQQRLSLARAFINEPSIVLADEPTGNLDSENSKRILDLMNDLHRNKKSTIALVTHEPDVAKKAERIIVMDDGKIIKDSLPASYND
jgi:putative ABC transport system ATP-binding protein